MNKLIFSAIIAIAASSVQAEGFAPWPDPSHGSNSGTQTIVASGTTAPQSFYSAGLPQRDDRIDAVQQAITIVPYYLANR